jgi:hypothetical protein
MRLLRLALLALAVALPDIVTKQEVPMPDVVSPVRSPDAPAPDSRLPVTVLSIPAREGAA